MGGETNTECQVLWSHPPRWAPSIHTCLFPCIHSRAARVSLSRHSHGTVYVTPLLKHSGLTSVLDQRPNHNTVFRTWYQLLPSSPPSSSTSCSSHWAAISSTSIPHVFFAPWRIQAALRSGTLSTDCSLCQELSPLHPFACLSHTTDLSLKICSSVNSLPHTSLPLPAPSTVPSRTYHDM